MAGSAWDLLALVLVGLTLAAAFRELPATFVPVQGLEPISLAASHLADYALHSTLRMFAALGLSLAFSLLVAPLAAKSKRCGMILVPMLDVLQSIPVLAFVSVSSVLANQLLPGRVLGAELACVLTIATSQAWSMAFSLYQSLKTIPAELDEAARVFQLTGWQRFWRVEMPFALPSLVWNAMASLSSGWFFVVAAEAIVVGQTNIQLPGLGSYVAVALRAQDRNAIVWATLAMLLVVLLCDQLLFRPLVAWVGRFRNETLQGRHDEAPWVLRLLRQSRLLDRLSFWPRRLAEWISWYPLGGRSGREISTRQESTWLGMIAWYGGLAISAVYGMAHMLGQILHTISLHEILAAAEMGGLTLMRVLACLIAASLIWVPLGVMIGLRPRLARVARPIAQVLASFPANLIFPILVGVIVRYRLQPDIWLTPLMLLGAQWYVLFNVLAGAQAFPADLREVARGFGVGGWVWWRRVMLPAIMPYFATGAIAASGAAWNASIVAEYVQWGNTTLSAHGIGAYIAQATHDGDGVRLLLGVFIISRYVVVLNTLIWQPLYRLAQRRCA